MENQNTGNWLGGLVVQASMSRHIELHFDPPHF